MLVIHTLELDAWAQAHNIPKWTKLHIIIYSLLPNYYTWRGESKWAQALTHTQLHHSKTQTIRIATHDSALLDICTKFCEQKETIEKNSFHFVRAFRFSQIGTNLWAHFSSRCVCVCILIWLKSNRHTKIRVIVSGRMVNCARGVPLTLTILTYASHAFGRFAFIRGEITETFCA